ncbi:hypothetical protein Syun_030230 [Stephania yunnanensis]|uniref:Uncharacterized protein n=1 Tax=Stephania yunnanensis TaxID=152371 RepID=A0AAP0E762_9MAGN
MGERTWAFNAADKGIEDLHNVDIQLATRMVGSPFRDNWRKANETLQGSQEEGHTQLDVESQSDDSGESREIEVGVDMDEFIMETLEEQSLEAQLMDTTLTEALTENLIEREAEAIQHLSRVAVGLPPIGSTILRTEVVRRHQ